MGRSKSTNIHKVADRGQHILTMNVGPQVDIPVGAPENPGSNIGTWNGLTIKEILEKVDLSNIIMEEDNKKQLTNKDPMISRINPESAFLGPKLWSRSIPMPMTGGQENEDFSVMNIDDFLSENGFDLEQAESDGTYEGVESPRSSSDMDQDLEEPEVPCKKMKKADPAARPTKLKLEGDNTFLYVESKRARMEREKEEKRKRAAREIEFTPQELALATVPGVNFDPRERRFAPDELRPQPIIRKRKKSFVPTDCKAEKPAVPKRTRSHCEQLFLKRRTTNSELNWNKARLKIWNFLPRSRC